MKRPRTTSESVQQCLREVCGCYLRFGGSSEKEEDEEDKEEPSFELSGKLTAETNTYRVRLHTPHSLASPQFLSELS